MAMPGSGCIIFPLGPMAMFDLACASRDAVCSLQLHVQHIKALVACLILHVQAGMQTAHFSYNVQHIKATQ